MPGRPPPGRAGRVWLAARVQVARRAAELLDHKQQLLAREERRLAELTDRLGREWAAAVADADTWCARALVSGGRDDLRRAGRPGSPAQVTLTWVTQAGVTYPSTTSVRLPPPANPGTGATLTRAGDAYRHAVEVAVRYAAASAAAARITAERAATARRLRAIEERWLPTLERDLADLEVHLDEVEREEIIRLRWATASATRRELP